MNLYPETVTLWNTGPSGVGWIDGVEVAVASWGVGEAVIALVAVGGVPVTVEVSAGIAVKVATATTGVSEGSEVGVADEVTLGRAMLSVGKATGRSTGAVGAAGNRLGTEQAERNRARIERTKYIFFTERLLDLRRDEYTLIVL